jgi:predicted metal-dependent hydrolase
MEGRATKTEHVTAKSSLKIPAFASEAEEAKWWFENEDLIAKEFEKAAKEGRLGRGGIRRLFAERGIPFKEPKPTPTTTIRLDREDIAKARVQAAERGLRYQTYLKMIIHEALLRQDEQKRKSA